ncbi:hypothetical protein JG687_00012704 [Phytophthora cactorum]|uniref:Uncharacterized protein n=1 Tax=Phytophthora cactorum TaxID=29920 RepID=A0A329RIS6_9STRA|nr:hypothetical protein Pcac1_g4370 [Phytophthora cactorum]KAG2804990.1 hypothetical protein PC112_g18464 [Phytophthora cactorum]KAG2805275.1 hypothetical protein PC111_g17891 [Phytophthora cactorum]KAG2857668.1 hypothetical protein PC113_g10502 [Phytophthora cactorum]KAG2906318.1 hypothetical protein PC114_g11165 [Phytophthora cactorum]
MREWCRYTIEDARFNRLRKVLGTTHLCVFDLSNRIPSPGTFLEWLTPPQETGVGHTCAQGALIRVFKLLRYLAAQ